MAKTPPIPAGSKPSVGGNALMGRNFQGLQGPAEASPVSAKPNNLLGNNFRGLDAPTRLPSPVHTSAGPKPIEALDPYRYMKNRNKET